jgi:hypothetical protein
MTPTRPTRVALSDGSTFYVATPYGEMRRIVEVARRNDERVDLDGGKTVSPDQIDSMAGPGGVLGTAKRGVSWRNRSRTRPRRENA